MKFQKMKNKMENIFTKATNEEGIVVFHFEEEVIPKKAGFRYYQSQYLLPIWVNFMEPWQIDEKHIKESQQIPHTLFESKNVSAKMYNTIHLDSSWEDELSREEDLVSIGKGDLPEEYNTGETVYWQLELYAT